MEPLHRFADRALGRRQPCRRQQPRRHVAGGVLVDRGCPEPRRNQHGRRPDLAEHPPPGRRDRSRRRVPEQERRASSSSSARRTAERPGDRSRSPRSKARGSAGNPLRGRRSQRHRRTGGTGRSMRSGRTLGSPRGSATTSSSSAPPTRADVVGPDQGERHPHRSPGSVPADGQGGRERARGRRLLRPPERHEPA